MKFQKLFFNTAIGCLLVGASGAAIAQETCVDGFIVSEQVPGDVVLDQQTCFIMNSTIEGDLTATNSGSEGLFTYNVIIEGDLTATNSAFVGVSFTTVEGLVQIIGNGEVGVAWSNFVADTSSTPPNQVGGNALSVVTLSRITDDLRVNENVAALVEQNLVGGDLECVGNLALDAGLNAVSGEENCRETIP